MNNQFTGHIAQYLELLTSYPCCWSNLCGKAFRQPHYFTKHDFLPGSNRTLFGSTHNCHIVGYRRLLDLNIMHARMKARSSYAILGQGQLSVRAGGLSNHHEPYDTLLLTPCLFILGATHIPIVRFCELCLGL
ncbi:hypothetical protein CRM22_001823 [Opisthorchis felineus]|uniref:Uncharacterized protein n=1 Tax=Opisthorchis felineus TaxID=147828 RepID=A0A4S2M8U1_OPIFE|nr:hypothetical protein CRM22_001823 [Opisthorchis felineus]